MTTKVIERSEAVLIPPESEIENDHDHHDYDQPQHKTSVSIKFDDDEQSTTNRDIFRLSNMVNNGMTNCNLQKLEEKAQKAQEAFEKEEKMRKELEALNSKLLAEKTALLDSLSGEKGALQEYQEKTAKLTAQKNDVENQLRVSKI
jgi:hypothetical protein